MKIPVKVTIDLDLDSYRREYSDNTEPLDEIRQFMRDSIAWNLRDFTKRWSYIRSVKVEGSEVETVPFEG